MVRYKKDIIFLFNDAFPVGMAGTNRLISLAAGIVKQGFKTIVLCLRPTENKNSILNTRVEGNYKGISYLYTAKKTIWPTHKTLKFFFIVRGLFFGAKEIIDNKNAFALISPVDSFRINIFFYVICKLKGIKYIRIVDEYPPYVLNPNNYGFLYVHIMEKYFYKLFDGALVISNELREYYKSRMKKGTRIELIHMTVESDRFSCSEVVNCENYIAYCGNIGYQNKDGLPILLRAFKIFSTSIKDYKLYIIGDTKQEDERNLLFELVRKLDLYNKVVFTGKVHRDDIPKYLCNAKILVLSRPNNVQSKAGFPTKLGEYLATGNPVVVTKVGEIEDFLIDEENAFLTEPNNPENFAHKMLYVVRNYAFAREVGERGRALTEKVFNGDVQSEKIIKLVEELYARS